MEDQWSKWAPWTRSAVCAASSEVQRRGEAMGQAAGAQQGGCRRRLWHPAPLLSEHPPSSHEGGPPALPWVGPACTKAGRRGSPDPGRERGLRAAAGPAPTSHPQPPSGKMPCASHLKIPGDTRVVNLISDTTRDPGSSSAIPRHLRGWEASSRSCAAQDLCLSSARPSCSEQWPMAQL